MTGFQKQVYSAKAKCMAKKHLSMMILTSKNIIIHLIKSALLIRMIGKIVLDIWIFRLKLKLIL